MRKALIALLVLVAGIVYADQVPEQTVYPRRYGDLSFSTLTNTIDTRIDGAIKLVDLTGGYWPVTTNYTVPSNIVFRIPPDCGFNISTGSTLTLNCGIEANDTLIFTGDGLARGTAQFANRFLTWGDEVQYNIGNGTAGDINADDITADDITADDVTVDVLNYNASTGTSSTVSVLRAESAYLDNATIGAGTATTFVVENSLVVSNFDITPQNAITVAVTTANSVQDIQDSIDSLKSSLLEGTQVYYSFAAGTYDWTSRLDVARFNGDGAIFLQSADYSSGNFARTNQTVILDGANYVVNGTREMINIIGNRGIQVEVDGMKFESIPDGLGGGTISGIGVGATSTDRVVVRDCSFQTTNMVDTTAVYMQSVPSASVTECKFTGGDYAVWADINAKILCYNITNTATLLPDIGQRATGNGTVGITASAAGGATPLFGCEGTSAPDDDTGGGEVRR